uniref:Juvenile hormone acid O-methyltransferase n=1 Tax=Epicauta chinensis TaxID=941254 RepID=A0A2C9DK13_9CUCU|nr:juvenile hormone acid O-methyltransferase [Epicauta chinensis]
MNQPDLYAKSNQITRTTIGDLLDKYIGLMRWQSDEKNVTILDIGCGDGGVLFDSLLPKLPQNFHKLYGIDISQEFLDYASKRNNDKRIVFEKFDIASNELPLKYCQQFDHAFSFYCLHWVADQKKAFENIYNMLKPGGDMMLAFLGIYPLFAIYEILAKTSKWSKYMYDFDKFISPYHHSRRPDVEMEHLLTRQGFISLECQAIPSLFTFETLISFIQLIKAVNPFISRLPEDEVDNYLDDFVGEVRQMKNFTIETDENGREGRIQMAYELLFVVASKPEDSQ